MSMNEIPQDVIDNICLSYRHDFGSPGMDRRQEHARKQCIEWIRVLEKHGWKRPDPETEPPQPQEWVPPAVLQGAEWEKWTISRRNVVQSELTRIHVERPGMPNVFFVTDNRLSPVAISLKLTHTHLCGLKPGQSVPLGPQPKPAWRVPEHLRHAAYNGWEIRRSCHKEYGDGYAAFCRPSPQGYTAVLYDGRLTDLAIVLLLTKEDFMQMQPNDVYKLGEAK